MVMHILVSVSLSFSSLGVRIAENSILTDKKQTYNKTRT